MSPILARDDPPIKAGPPKERPDNPVLPFRRPSATIEPPGDVGGWLTLLENLKDTKGPIAARTRRHARKRLRQAGWRVSRIRKAVAK